MKVLVYFRKGGKLDNRERILNLTYEFGFGSRTRATDADIFYIFDLISGIILASFTIGGPRLRWGDYKNFDILYGHLAKRHI